MRKVAPVFEEAGFLEDLGQLVGLEAKRVELRLVQVADMLKIEHWLLQGDNPNLDSASNLEPARRRCRFAIPKQHMTQAAALGFAPVRKNPLGYVHATVTAFPGRS
jgi:hypothetical protein